MTMILVPAKTLQGLVDALLSAADKTLTPKDAALAVVRVVSVQAMLEEAARPFGQTPGQALTVAPAGREPIFSMRFDAPEWQADRQQVAYALESAATKAAPHVKFDDTLDPFFAHEPGYFSGVLAALNAQGFDTLHNRAEGFAVYAPQFRPAPAANSFRKAASHATPRP